MKPLFSIILSLLCLSSYCQVENGCITIDFESFPGQVPFSGMVLSDQYKDEFGLSFSLENGGFPVLARVGPPVEAFGSVWGSDEPAPGVDIGEYFLTDDGLLSGTYSPPIILTFETPIDSFAGCILDIDFDEYFIIQALDGSGTVILEDRFDARANNQDDGQLTCWGFNLPGCEGSIYTIRYSGFRPGGSGAFGLGMDKFSFCYSGLHIDRIKTDATCSTFGTVQLFSLTNETYEYSLDGINFSTEGYYEDLDPGFHIFYVRDSDNCTATLPVEVLTSDPFISDFSAVNTTCGLDNGTISLIIDQANNPSYTIDEINYQSSNVFEDLAPGDYTVLMRDEDGCVLEQDYSILPSTAPEFDLLDKVDDKCESAEGIIEVSASGGEGTLTYTIDGINFQEDNSFTGLAAGMYYVTVEDALGCTTMDSIEITTTPEVVFADLSATPAVCYEDNGTISILGSGGEGVLQYSLDNGTSLQTDTLFSALAPGSYEIMIIDIHNCTAYQSITIDSPDPAIITALDVQNTTCGYDNGAVLISVAFDGEVMYSINGGVMQNDNQINNLPAGTYNVDILDEYGCAAASESFTIEPSIIPTIDDLVSSPEECGRGNGQFEIIAGGGIGDLSYSMDSINFSSTNEFTNLTEGSYTAYVMDEIGCVIETVVRLEGTPPVEVYMVDITEPDCFQENGIINIGVEGGTGEISYSLNDGPIQNSGIYENMTGGDYSIYVYDVLGCDHSYEFTVEMPLCPIYFPNIFTPNENTNNRYVISTEAAYGVDILKYHIYDRWGELVYSSLNFDIHKADSKGWDGYFRGEKAVMGVYTYLIEAAHPNGKIKYYGGDFLLLR